MMTRWPLCVVYRRSRRSRTESPDEEADLHLPHKQVIHTSPGWWRVPNPRYRCWGALAGEGSLPSSLMLLLDYHQKMSG